MGAGQCIVPVPEKPKLVVIESAPAEQPKITEPDGQEDVFVEENEVDDAIAEMWERGGEDAEISEDAIPENPEE